jgi:hypothetical protein
MADRHPGPASAVAGAQDAVLSPFSNAAVAVTLGVLADGDGYGALAVGAKSLGVWVVDEDHACGPQFVDQPHGVWAAPRFPDS